MLFGLNIPHVCYTYIGDICIAKLVDARNEKLSYLFFSFII